MKFLLWIIIYILTKDNDEGCIIPLINALSILAIIINISYYIGKLFGVF